MSNEVEAIGAVGGVKKSSSNNLANNLFNRKHIVEHVSYAIIVMEVLNKVGLQHQQKIMQLRGKLMDVMTRMQNDFTTISEYVSQIENNAHSGGGGYEGSHGFTTWGENAFNGLDNSFFKNTGKVTTANGSNHGSEGKLSDFGEDVSSSFKTSTQGFVNAVKDLFMGSASGSGLTVADISKINNPTGGPAFNFGGPKGGYWKTLSDSFKKKFPGSGALMVMSNPSAHPSLLQQYMYYKTQVDIFTMPKSTLKAADGQVDKIENFDPNGTTKPGQPSPDSLLGTFIEMLSALNQPISVNRNGQKAMLSKSAPSLLEMIGGGASMKFQLKAAQKQEEKWHSGVVGPAGHDHDHMMYYNQVQPGIYQAVSMMAFNYFWTKNPNAATDAGASNTTLDPSEDQAGQTDSFDSKTKGTPSSDPLSNLYMTNNAVQTNISQQSSQGNNNFQADVNVTSQLDNMGVNATKSFFEGTSTMNRNCRIS
ncbi:hypothetical protein COB11_01630 [Candidatus Aerophobetes bacterium]|uniref:Uncharacterized protein n=1 Tax=Aerophobetes bacterium TaxID=2030807 RepID=A0A2A4YM22_UNCAE|nr:MAG: hypothetical protein COB11_01630 [Candidatus Aerophobetes bacterium]